MQKMVNIYSIKTTEFYLVHAQKKKNSMWILMHWLKKRFFHAVT
jgi:hypothetical protein